MENKIFLLNLLQLTSNIIKDSTEAVTIAGEFNKAELTKDQEGQLKDNINSLINEDINNVSLLKDVINAIDILNKQYLISMLELRSLNFQNEGFKKVIYEKLSASDITFDNDTQKYMYYSLLVNLTIASRDTELIKLAIDKIQNM
ncbi:hypothetical protein [Clostridium sporogenes]|uniref:hypothetical protein n=1 Tax=Clostridium sporogenes TaxID=1509 RepID=UPI002237F554|nr:hypothetical protein [Clostridium sporogenes]MCW6088803.1 hypothetical protein [Clostridium sporogenes]